MLEWEQPPPEPVLDADGVPLPDQPPPPGPQYDEETGAELPPELPERDPTEWVRAYVQYVQIFRRLERAYDQMSHPQKRVEVKRTLEATIGRCLELRHWVLKKFGRELEHVSLDEVLEDMNLPVDAMEIPVPRYFVDDRRHELGARDTFLEALLHKFETAKPELGKPNVFVGRVNWTKPVPEYMTRDVFAPPPLSQEEAEAKRIEDERIAEEYRSDLEERVNILAATKTKDEIATVIQKYARGWLARREYERLMDEELVFLGMRPAPRPEDPRDDPILRDMANNQMRKKAQYANQDEYLAAYENLKDRVKERHGQEMREEVQDKINAWFLENRDPETGAFPDFPDVGNGGSADILNPPPKEDDDAAATEGLSFDDIAAAAGGLSPADVAPLYLVALAGTNGELTVVAVDCSTGCIRSDNTTVVAAGDAPVDAGVGNAVVRVTFSPNGAALAVTCGGGAMAVYAVEKPPIEAFTILKDETDPLKDGDEETELKDDDDVAASAEGEGDDAPPAGTDTEDTEGGGEANTEASSGPVDFVAARDAARRLKPLVWLTADYAARTFGPFEPKTDVAEGESAPEGAEGAAETAPAEGEGATQGEPEDPSKRAKGAPTVHFRCSGDEANAAFVSWRNTNRLAMFQLTGARNMPSKLALVPTLRGEEPEPEEEATEGDGDYGAEEDPKPPKPTPPAGDWTMPFPISATASTDGGALLALAMIDGSIVLFNARLGAVARTFRRIGNFGPGLDGFDPSAPPSAADDSHVERAASEPLACAALSFWTRVDDTEGSGGVENRALVAVTEAGWAAVFDLDASPYNSPDSDEPALRITPRGVPRVPMFGGLTCQRHGSRGLACGVEPPKPKEGDDEDEDTDEDEEKEEEVNKEDTEAAAVEDGEKGEEVEEYENRDVEMELKKGGSSRRLKLAEISAGRLAEREQSGTSTRADRETRFRGDGVK